MYTFSEMCSDHSVYSRARATTWRAIFIATILFIKRMLLYDLWFRTYDTNNIDKNFWKYCEETGAQINVGKRKYLDFIR